MKKIYFLAFLFLCTFLTIGTNTAWGETVTYTVSKKDAVTASGTAPTGSSVTYLQTFATPKQITKGNSATLTLSGFEGKKITGIVLNMQSNKSQGAGKFSAVAGTTTIASIASATTFDKWYDNTSYGSPYRNVTVKLTNSDYAIKTGEKVVITIAATVNSLYIQSYTITYTSAAPSCTPPTFTIADKTISLSEAVALYDMSTNLTINKGGSSGLITYVCNSADVDIDGNIFYTEKAGIYTINATMAADATYCEATTTFSITVLSTPCTKLEKPTGLSASVTAYNSAILSWNTVDNAAKYQITTTPPRVRR